MAELLSSSTLLIVLGVGLHCMISCLRPLARGRARAIEIHKLRVDSHALRLKLNEMTAERIIVERRAAQQTGAASAPTFAVGEDDEIFVAEAA